MCLGRAVVAVGKREWQFRTRTRVAPQQQGTLCQPNHRPRYYCGASQLAQYGSERGEGRPTHKSGTTGKAVCAVIRRAPRNDRSRLLRFILTLHDTTMYFLSL